MRQKVFFSLLLILFLSGGILFSASKIFKIKKVTVNGKKRMEFTLNPGDFPDATIHVWEDIPRKFAFEVKDNYDNYSHPVSPSKIKYKLVIKNYSSDGSLQNETEVVSSDLKEYLLFTKPNYELIQEFNSGSALPVGFTKYFYVIEAKDVNSEIIPPTLRGLEREEDNLTKVYLPIMIHDLTPPKVKIIFNEVGKGKEEKTEVILDYLRGEDFIPSLSSKLYIVKPATPPANYLPSSLLGGNLSDARFPKNKAYLIGIKGKAFLKCKVSSNNGYLLLKMPLICKGETKISLSQKFNSKSYLNPTLDNPMFYLNPASLAEGNKLRKRISLWQNTRTKITIKCDDNSGVIKKFSCKLVKFKNGFQREIFSKKINNLVDKVDFSEIFILKEASIDKKITTSFVDLPYLKYEFILQVEDLAGNKLTLLLPIKVIKRFLKINNLNLEN